MGGVFLTSFVLPANRGLAGGLRIPGKPSQGIKKKQLKLSRRPLELSNLSVDTAPRLEGVHLTEIIQDMMQTALPQKFRKYSEAEQKRFGPYREMGFVWERVVASAFREQLAMTLNGDTMRGIQLEGDHGIVMHPDFIDLGGRVVEAKATWKSSRKVDNFEEEFPHWLMQGGAYAHWAGVGRCDYPLFWVCGDYRGSGPQVEVVSVEWTARELEENWKQIVNHARWKKMVRWTDRELKEKAWRRMTR